MGLRPGEYEQLHKRAVTEHDMIRTMPVIAGAADALWRLSDAGIWIRIITHRLYVNWGHATRGGRHRRRGSTSTRIPYRDLCFLGAKPEVRGRRLRRRPPPHNVTAPPRRSATTVIVYDQPYNRDLVDGSRAHDWVEVESLVAELVADRFGQVALPLPGIDAGGARLAQRRGLP